MSEKKALLTVFGKDRPGIIAGITEVFFERGCNLEDMSMTLLEGEFAMMMIFSFNARERSQISAVLEKIRIKYALVFFWRDIQDRLRRGEKHGRGAQSSLITAIGKDQTGIVFKISRLLARLGLNITDLNSRILGHGRHALYALMLEVDLPKKFKINRLERSLERLSKKLRIEIHLKPTEHIEI
ncbi:MAG TPA: ACT domain-containing protein [bacterium]|nr:ACT domain-containing protein [bacterium]